MKILVAYDGSECADAALDDLRRAGLGRAGEMLVLSMADVFLPSPGDKAEELFPPNVPDAVKRAHERARQMLYQAKELAREASERLQSDFPGWHIVHEAEPDSPAWGLIKKSDEWKPDLVVMGARGLSVFGGRLILGSVSQRVLYEARCSVRIARGRYGDAEKPVRILIGVDNSVDSEAAVKAVCDRDWPKGTEAALLAVVDTVMSITPDPAEPSIVKWLEVSEEEDWDQVRDLVEPAAQKLRNAGIHTDILIRRGNPADQILEEAQTWDADCIFVGAKGTRGIDRLLLGSVSSAVAARAHCSVEVVRPEKVAQ